MSPFFANHSSLTFVLIGKVPNPVVCSVAWRLLQTARRGLDGKLLELRYQLLCWKNEHARIVLINLLHM